MAYAEYINVLLEVAESKRPLRSTLANLVSEVTKEAERIAGQPVSLSIASSSSSTRSTHILQRFSKEWNCFIDVLDIKDVQDRDRLTIAPCKVHITSHEEQLPVS